MAHKKLEGRGSDSYTFNGFVEWAHNSMMRSRHSSQQSEPLWPIHGQR
jgi:hypothetical protein